MKRILMVAGACALALLLAAVLVLRTPHGAGFDRRAALAASADYDARILRDAYGVPHIYGESDADAAFGLAYAHAEDDWETIAETIVFSRGRLAARTGRDGAVTDYLVAALNVWDDIEAQYESALSPETRALVEAYAAGINYWCAEERGRCARDTAPVSGKDVVAGFVIRTPFFYGLDDELTKLFEAAPDRQAALLRARHAALYISPGDAIGSNAIAVAPSRSTDGHTRLMVNSHQPFKGPVAWYEARVKSEEGWDMIGGLFPGSPVISHGAGPRLGWAFTVNKPDLVDVYRLEVDDEKNPKRYRFEGEWRTLEKKTVWLRVRLAGPFSLPVPRAAYRSVHGPVFDTPGGFYAVSYGGMGDIRSVEQFYRLNKAQSFDEWREAMALQAVPSFNVIYADGDGTIAYYYNAAIPQRSPGQDWSEPAAGDRADLVWNGVRPFGSAPFVVNPPSGYVANANNNPYEATAPQDAPQREEYPAHFGIDERTTNRGVRIAALYGADEAISGEEFVAYKMDHIYAENSRLMALVRRYAALSRDGAGEGDPLLAEALAVISRWNGAASIENREAALAIRAGRLALSWYLDAEANDDEALDALRKAAEELQTAFGRLDPEWGEVMRLKRGGESWPVNGGPETLRAIYPGGPTIDGAWEAVGGDSYILYADWPGDGGAPRIRTIHQYGAATLDETSPHYADQAPLFAAEQWKEPPMTLDALIAEATADYRPGSR